METVLERKQLYCYTGGMTVLITELELKPVLAANVCILRNANGLTQQELACKSGVSRATVNRIEKGMHVPKAGLLYNLADALGVTSDRLRQLS